VDLRRPLLRGPHDPNSFGRASERIARFLGTGRFLVYMTAVVLIWIGWNVFAPRSVYFDHYPFILLTLVLSLQASYAGPLILLAQNRQDDRDRVNLDADRRQGTQSRADTDFLAREVASLRVAVGEVATRDYVRSEIRSVVDSLSELLGDGAGDGEPARRVNGSGSGSVGRRSVGSGTTGRAGADGASPEGPRAAEHPRRPRRPVPGPAGARSR